MIKLEVQDYCQGCPKFEPDVERPVSLYIDGGPKPYVTMGDTIIRCEYRHICERVSRVTKGEQK